MFSHPASCSAPGQPAGGTLLQQRAGWHAAFTELREANHALLDCLADAGLLSPQTFEARLHRRRFAAARRAHPCKLRSSLADALEPSGTALAAAEFAGLSAARAVEAGSRSLAHTVAAIA